MIGRWLCRAGFHAWELWFGWRVRTFEVCRRCRERRYY